MNRFLIIASLVLSCVFAHAGEIHFVSSSLLTYSPATSTLGGHLASSSYQLSGKVYGLNVSVGPTSPVTYNSGTIQGSVLADVSVEMKVEWTPSFPGEAQPTGLVAKWTVTSSSQADLFGTFKIFGSGASVAIGGLVSPDPHGTSFNETFLSTTPPFSSGPATSYAVISGGFEFHAENGKWIGVGAFSLPTGIGVSGSIPSPEEGWITAGISSTLTLTHAGSMVVQ